MTQRPRGPAGKPAGTVSGQRAEPEQLVPSVAGGRATAANAAVDPSTGPIPVVGQDGSDPRRTNEQRREAAFAPPATPSNSAVLTTPVGGRARRPATRRARLTLTRVDPWSVLKASLVFTTCLLVVWMVAVCVLYGILAGAGVFDSINQTLSDVLATHVNFNGFGVIFGALILGAFNVVLMSALATVAAFAYNITASVIGGLDVTLAERE